MRFDSLVFAVFFVAFVAIYWRLRSHRSQNLLILVGSYVFYGWWDWRFLLLIAASTIVDYTVALRLEQATTRRGQNQLLVVSVLVNLGILGFFKYFDFFVTSTVEMLAKLGLEVSPPLLEIILPVGISFYTFQTMAYTIDVYRGRMPATSDFTAMACYVAFFPQLVAGPIERAGHLLPQFQRPRSVTVEDWRSGATLIVYGLVKKIAIADNMAPFVDMVFAMDASEVSGPLVLAGTLAFAVQIYADFSGYTDVARGVARLLGFDLCLNFNKPYIAISPSDFWRRWHISLSQWLRDYLYISLGGNRTTELRTYRNLMITMVLGGLWHGAAWNFVIWGVFHGGILCIYRFFDADRRIAARGPGFQWLVAVPVMFALTLYGWMLFRAETMTQIGAFTAAMVTSWSDWTMATPLFLLVGYFALPIVVHHAIFHGKAGEKYRPASPLLWRAVLVGVILYGIVHARASETAFIYFQF